MKDLLSELSKVYPLSKTENNLGLVQELFRLCTLDNFTPLEWTDRARAYDIAVLCGHDLRMAQEVIALLVKEEQHQNHVLLRYRADLVGLGKRNTWVEYVSKTRDRLKIIGTLEDKELQQKCIALISPRHILSFLQSFSLREGKQMMITLAHGEKSDQAKVFASLPFLQRKYYNYHGEKLKVEEFEQEFMTRQGLLHILEVRFMINS